MAAYLFEIQERTVFPNPETLLIEPFKSIWERDKTKTKEKALEELAYIEFMASMKKSNPYKGYPEDVKKEKIENEIITIKNWKPDKLVLQGIEKIKEFQTDASTSYIYYMSAKIGLEKMREFFLNFDMNERNIKSGTPLYKPKDITSAINDIEKNLQNLKALEKRVEEEIFEEERNKGNKEISPFAKKNGLD